VKLVKKKAIFNVEPKPVMERQGRYRLLATDIFGVFQYLRWSSSEFSQYFQYHSLLSRILRAVAWEFTASFDSLGDHTTRYLEQL
jgi:hypothetical protein